MRRTLENIRNRPAGYKRQDPFDGFVMENGRLDLVNPTDLEWMSLNYRKAKAASISLSKRRMIHGMF